MTELVTGFALVAIVLTVAGLASGIVLHCRSRSSSWDLVSCSATEA
ncbi:MAG: hypothetical protein M3475_08615 [Actinomycetota bacterium]|nr:hypothetical protein [Actinomycetota bacterium]